jgi:site-specific recombinase XerD
MTALAPTLQAFFTQRLAQRRVSPHTVAAYRDGLRLLIGYVHDTTGKDPCLLDFDDLDAARIGAFLDYLERDRHVSIATRNARLAAVHSLFAYAALQHPEHAASIARVLAIPPKRTERATVCFLTPTETDALVASPDRSHWRGRRDHALLLLAAQTGLRASELTALRIQDLHLGTGPHVDALGKGRKHRPTPLTTGTVAVLRTWLAERSGNSSDPVFPGPRGEPLTRDALHHLVTKHAATASSGCPSMAAKRVTPHTLRHTAAMRLLESGTDTSVIALWLGHESPQTTQIYLHAHLAIKERALSRAAAPNSKPGRYQPQDQLLAFLDSL